LISHQLPLDEMPRALELIESRDPAVRRYHPAERLIAVCVSIPESAGETSPTRSRDRFPDLLVLQGSAQGCNRAILDNLDVIDRFAQNGRGLPQAEFLQVTQ
jgi:hypothetical protein